MFWVELYHEVPPGMASVVQLPLFVEKNHLIWKNYLLNQTLKAFQLSLKITERFYTNLQKSKGSVDPPSATGVEKNSGAIRNSEQPFKAPKNVKIYT